jgi:hypothetical protein
VHLAEPQDITEAVMELIQPLMSLHLLAVVVVVQTITLVELMQVCQETTAVLAAVVVELDLVLVVVL